MNGKIKFYNVAKGYGFIIDNETQEEHFFHVTGLLYSNPQKEDEVTFELEETAKGVKGINVTLAEN